MLKTIVLVCAALFSGAAWADRYEFVLRHGEKELSGGKICFFPGGASSFGRQFLLSDDVRCLPADSLITIPAGTWNLFAVHDDGFVSTHPDFFIVPPQVGERIDRTVFTMLPTGRVDVAQARPSLRAGEHLAFYVTNEGRPASSASVRPVGPREEMVRVPADMTLVPLAVSRGSIAAVGEPFRVPASRTIVLSPFARDSKRTTVAIQLTVAPSWMERGVAMLKELPQVALTTTAGSRLEPLLALRPDGMWVNSLIFFRSVPTGNATLTVEGEFWRRLEATLHVDKSGAQMFEPPVALVPAGSVRVTWVHRGLPPPAGLVRQKNCSDTPSVAEAPIVRLVRCGGDPSPSGDGCTVVATTEIALTPGSTTFRGIPAGEYVVELRHGAGSMERRVRVAELAASEERFELTNRTIQGRVSRDGEPVRAQIEFGQAGTAFSDVVSGSYVAELNAPFHEARVVVRPCDGAAPVQILATLPDDATQFDIELPHNRLDVAVVDMVAGTPVPSAVITYALTPRERDTGVSFYQEVSASEGGTAVLEDVGGGGFVKLCADKTGYVRTCVPPFAIGADEEKRVRLELPRIIAREGRVRASRPVENGRLYFVANPGIVLGSARVAPDGRFVYELAGDPPGIYVVVLSRNLPLFALPYRVPAPGEPLVIDVLAPSRTVTIVRRSGAAPVPFTFALDGLAIPRFVVDQHQLFRNRESRIAPGNPLVVPDVAAARIDVIVGPEQPPRDLVSTSPYSDVFNTPGFAEALLRMAVPPQGTLTIP